jgi:hypothetical protein
MSRQAENDSHILLPKLGPAGQAQATAKNIYSSSHRSRRHARPGLRQLFSRLFYETWLLEICVMTLSIGCIIGAVIVLRVFDGKAQPYLPSGITLNAIVSTLGTASRAALVFVVAASMSQLKWNWYQKRQKLDEIQCFDDASRGPLGSLILLTRKPARSLASVAALITVAALIFDPFLQQVIEFYAQTVYVDASANGSQAVTGRGMEFLIGAKDTGFVERLNQGIWSDPTVFGRNPTCATGNCTWDVFESVGWCHKCENATSRVQLENCDFNVAPEDFANTTTFSANTDEPMVTRWCNVTFSGSEGKTGSIPMNFTDLTDPGSSISDTMLYTYWEYVWSTADLALENKTILGVENPISALNYIRIPALTQYDESDQSMTSIRIKDATECALDFCVRKYNISVQSGETHAEVLNSTFGQKFSWAGPEPSLAWDAYYCWKGRDVSLDQLRLEKVELPSPYNMLSSERTGYVDRDHYAFCIMSPKYMGGSNMDTEYWHWGRAISKMLQGSTRAEYECHDNSCRPVGTDLSETGGPDATDVGRWIHTVGLEKVMENLAAAFTNMTVATGGGDPVYGSYGQSVIFVRVRWAWLALPAGLSLSAAALLLATMLRTWQKGSPMWKASLLPLLYHGLDDETRVPATQWAEATHGQTGTHGVKVSEMMGVAAETRVRLKLADGDGGKLVLSS